MKRLCLIVIALVMLSPALASELTASRREQRIAVRIQNLDFPASLRKELVSGLTNRLLVRITLRRDSQILQEAAIEVAVRYDLWDEVFHVTTTAPGGETSRIEPTSEALLRALADLEFSDVFQPPVGEVNESLLMQADILLNPIDRERMDKIRQWVARNTTAVPGDSGSAARTSSAASMLFARIFEQFAAGNEVAAVWTRSLTSRPFRLNELPEDAR